MKIPELLAPAGNKEKALTAMAYGADALYLAGKAYGMRALAGNFDLCELREVVGLAREKRVKVYVTVNIFAQDEDLKGLPAYLSSLEELQVDALIVADPGVFRLCRKYAPSLPLHVSTQANVTNSEAVLFWQDVGASRIILARELPKEAICSIRKHTRMELEVFVHGAMCMAYSGRCLLSNVLTKRDANQGACVQSCRWKYAVAEETRPGEFMPLEEHPEGTYIFNSKDLCLLPYLPSLMECGLESFKIEGRMKSAYYVATVVRAYRRALDSYAKDPGNYETSKSLLEELETVSHRPYYGGFFASLDPCGTHLLQSTYEKTREFVGVVESYDAARGELVVLCRNRLRTSDTLEIMQPFGEILRPSTLTFIKDSTGEVLEEAHANYRIRIPNVEAKPYSMLRVVDETKG